MVLNEDENECLCDIANNYLSASDGTCYCCDISNDLVIGAFDDQCFGKANAEFDEETCGFNCIEEYEQVADQCVRYDNTTEDGTYIKCTGPGAFMTVDGECICDGNFFSIMSEDEPGLCVCDIAQRSFNYNKMCRTCTGVGNFVEEDDEFKCVCGNNAVFNLETIGDACICNIGYLEGDDNNCYKCDNGVFEPCLLYTSPSPRDRG